MPGWLPRPGRLVGPDGGRRPLLRNYRAGSQARGLVHWWPMMEGSGTTLTDRGLAASTLVNGTLTNTASTVWKGEALLLFAPYLDGSNDYINLGDLAVGPPLTLCFWLNPVLQDDQRMLTPSSAGSSHIAIRGPGGTGDVQILNSTGSAWLTVVSSQSTWRGAAHHVAITIASDGTARGYFDGVYSATTSGSSTTLNGFTTQFGSLFGGSFGLYYKGYWGDTRIYDRILSDTEIYQLAAPQSRWDLYEGSIRPFVFFGTAAAADTSVIQWRKPLCPERFVPPRTWM